jgi:hypothetical protein
LRLAAIPAWILPTELTDEQLLADALGDGATPTPVSLADTRIGMFNATSVRHAASPAHLPSRRSRPACHRTGRRNWRRGRIRSMSSS